MRTSEVIITTRRQNYVAKRAMEKERGVFRKVSEEVTFELR